MAVFLATRRPRLPSRAILGWVTRPSQRDTGRNPLVATNCVAACDAEGWAGSAVARDHQPNLFAGR